MAEKADIEAALHRAKRKGGTAVEGFQLIPLSSKQRPSKDPAHEFVKRLHQHRAELDQMSMTAALNIAAIEYGTASVEQAIRTVSKSMSETWQNTRWLGEDKSMKIVGPGRTLL